MNRRQAPAAVPPLPPCALVLVLVLSACTPAPEQPAQRPEAPAALAGWDTVHLPGDLIPATVASVGGDVLVGGFVGSGAERAPALARGSADDTSPAWQPVSLRPSTPYGKVASLVSLAGDGRSIVAVGAAHGGAHANFRWTIWTGTPAGVVDRPQTFETFGGQEAGTAAGRHAGPSGAPDRRDLAGRSRARRRDLATVG